ncbi:MAG TPA: serine hydrolase domain-containing protein [Pyrinomonadaceae bacterium]|nr:serine hydrolase domain-containing protein [Pyrinomonadaceae bacterium]
MKRRAREICWLVVFCLGLVITQAIAKPGSVKPAPAIDFTELDKLIPAELKEKNTPGTVITVISGDQIIYQKAFGVANIETNAEMQTEMLFRLGSTTKMFTAAALLSLAEQNKIKMNEPIGSRVKGLNAKLGQVTPHHLLSNSAGIRDFAAPVISNDDPSLGNMIRGWKEDVFFADQGEIYSYSSPGYWLSGLVVEELQGKPYADAMTELLFKPIGMERTTLRPFMAITYPFATGHVVQEGKATIIRPMFNNVAMWPAGSIFSNAKDLSRWVIALMNEGRVDGKQLLSTALINQMVGHHVPVPGESDSYYGYGLTVFKYKGLEFVGHGGFSRGYGSMIQMVPSRKFAVIVLTNKSGETMRKSLNKAMELGLGLKDDEEQKPATVAAATASEMTEYAGTYSHAPQTWEVSIKEGKLNMKFDGKDYAMTKSGERKFTFGAQNENEVVFVPGRDGKIGFMFTELYGAKKIR